MTRQIKYQRKLVKTEQLFFRTSPELKMEIIQESERQGKSISEYVRDLVKEDLKSKR